MQQRYASESKIQNTRTEFDSIIYAVSACENYCECYTHFWICCTELYHGCARCLHYVCYVVWKPGIRPNRSCIC